MPVLVNMSIKELLELFLLEANEDPRRPNLKVFCDNMLSLLFSDPLVVEVFATLIALVALGRPTNPTEITPHEDAVIDIVQDNLVILIRLELCRRRQMLPDFKVPDLLDKKSGSSLKELLSAVK